MKRFILLALLCASVQSQSLVYEHGGNSVRLLPDACDIPPIAMVMIQAEPSFEPRRALISISGNDIPACWTFSEGKVLIADILGNAGFMQINQFKQTKHTGV